MSKRAEHLGRLADQRRAQRRAIVETLADAVEERGLPVSMRDARAICGASINRIYASIAEFGDELGVMTSACGIQRK